ncbi:nuclear GTPase SLIP-GC-like [Megalobrama amblycephala]|uniref:nuclear GTPase SLIP-GC-like n=1 Tax=Megalobrama amblycephala TaxID=75352 RepID=UPI0020141304|nr:nuclear GTPase SLIP-GC-like [Megalobrama amblycephala]XP_048058915.1 nuclear GTPase SLIP-GC-like [Megalobrama amblycephala]
MALSNKVEDCIEWEEEAKEKDFYFKRSEERKMGEESDYEPMEDEEDNRSMDKGPKFAVVTLQDTDEVMVAASDWLSTDKKQCYWPPFKSTEKYLEAVKNNLGPSTEEKPWEMLNVIFHAEYDTYEDAVNNQVEQRALKYGLVLYKVVTLKESNELTVIPATWLNEEKTQCHWPPFKSPEKCTEAVKNRLEPPVTVEKQWETLNIQVHMECATYKQAMEKQKSLKEQKERFFFKSPLFSVPASTLPQIPPHDTAIPLCGVRGVLDPIPSTSWPKGLSIDFTMASQGIKRKRDQEPSSSIKSLLTTDMEIMLKAKQIMKRVTDNLVHTIIMQGDIISKINKMNNVSRKKATIGIFGKSGEGKSSLLSAVLGEKDLLPSGCFGACTTFVIQVEANLTDSNYIAEIHLVSKEDWEKELKDLFTVLSEMRTSDSEEDMNDDLVEVAEEKITALYGADADKKTLEEFKNDKKYAEIETFLSNSKDNKKTISKSDVSEFANDISCYILSSQSSPGGWYWPLVKSVTIKIPDCRELLEHIVLVDIPGTGDCNKIRDDLWKPKLRDCSSVWIVSDVKRAVTDKDPWGILKHCVEKLGPGGECKCINFICTKTDDINPAAYIRAEWLTIDHNLEDKDQKKVCILHRNDHAKTRVKEKFENSEIKKRFSNVFLQVFTVSSNAFFDTSLNLERIETEIPKLQDDLRTLNQNINRELTRDYVNEAKGVLSLIQSVQLDTDKKTAETKDKIYTELEKNLKKALKELDSHFDTIYNDLEQRLSNGVKESVQLCVDSTKAMISPNIDKRGFHKILQALCKNGGCYWSKNWDVILDLNKQLTRHMHEYINEYFNLIFPVTGTTGKSVQEQIDKFSIIQNDSASPGSPILHHIQNFIKTEETKLKASLKRDVVDAKKQIYSSIQITIKKEMSSCYEEAAAVTGTGSMKKRQELLITTVDKMKHNMFKKAKTEVLKKFEKLKLYIKDALESELKRSMKLSLSQTSKIKLMDVSKEIEQLERLSEQLSN